MRIQVRRRSSKRHLGSPRRSPTTQETQLQDFTAAAREIWICSLVYHSFAQHQTMNESTPKEMSHFVLANRHRWNHSCFCSHFLATGTHLSHGPAPVLHNLFTASFLCKSLPALSQKTWPWGYFFSVTSISTCSLRSFLLKV